MATHSCTTNWLHSSSKAWMTAARALATNLLKPGFLRSWPSPHAGVFGKITTLRHVFEWWLVSVVMALTVSFKMRLWLQP